MAIRGTRGTGGIVALGALAAAVGLAGVGVVASDTVGGNETRQGSLGPSAIIPVTAPATTAGTAPAATQGVNGVAAPGVSATPDTSPTAVPTETAAPARTSVAPVETTPAAKPVLKPTNAPQKPGTGKTTKQTGSAPAKTSQAAAQPQGAAPLTAKPGSYAETSSGTITVSGNAMPISGNSTLVVDPASGQTQTQTTKDGNNSQLEKLVFGTDRVDATELSITSQLLDTDFLLSPQEPLVELQPGATWSWKADSTDGKEHLAFSGSYAGNETVVVGGATVTAALVKSTLVVTGSLATTITETDDYDPSDKLVVRDHQMFKGSYSGFPYTADITTTLNSLSPS